MLITYLERRRAVHGRVTDKPQTHPDLPGVTIIVPCFNEEKTAAKTIESLLALDYPKDKLHIFAINDGSTDGTQKVLETFSKYPQITVIQKENGGKHTALNLGISKATTDFVGCLDADSYATPDALKRIMRRFNDPEVMSVVPSLHIHAAQTVLQRMQKVEYILGVFLRTILAEINSLYVTPGPFSIFRKSVFDKVGLYRHAHNTEDMEMAMRLQAHNLKISCANDAVIYTSSPRTLPKLYKQRVRWTSGFLKNVRDYRHLLFNKKHGHVGTFVLPLMIFSALCVPFIVSSFIYDLGKSINQFVIHFQAIGMRIFEWTWPKFSLFYTRTTPVVLMGFVGITVLISFVIVGTLLSRGNKPKVLDFTWYVVLYSIISPFWFIKSLTNLILNKTTLWR